MHHFFGKIVFSARIYIRWGSKSLSRRAGRARVSCFLQLHRGAIAVRFDSPGNGLFAHFTWFLQVIQWARRQNREVVIRCSSPHYGTGVPGEDWLPLLLKQPQLGADTATWPELVIGEFEHLPFFQDSLPDNLAQARDLFQSQFVLADAISAELARQATALFGDAFPLGLHYRGTDKSLEAPKTPPEVALASARRAMAAATAPDQARPVLFVASDERSFIQFIATSLVGERVVWMNDTLRSELGKPLHQSGISQRSRLAREALIDCLLLAHCRVLIKTASMLSAWALILGRQTEAVLLSEPYERCRFFPDTLASKVGFSPGREAEAVAASQKARTQVLPIY